MSSRLTACLLRVKRVILTAGRSVPVYTDKQASWALLASACLNGANSGHSGRIRSLRRRGRVAAALNARPRLDHAQIHKRAMESALLFGRRRKVGFPAMLKQAGAGGKYRIERQTCLLQGDGPEKSNIKVRTRSGSKAIRGDVERLDRIKRAECAPRIVGEFELPIDPLRQYGLMVAVVHDENRTFGKIRCQLTPEPFPG